MAIRLSISPVYKVLWNLDIGSPLDSAIFCIFVSLSRLPLARYKKDSLSKFLVRWYDFSTIYPLRSAATPLTNEGAHLIIALVECLLGELVPNFGFVKSRCHFQRNIEVSTFKSKVKPSGLFLDKVESDLNGAVSLRVKDDKEAYLRETLLLEI